jgi:hypothetical protein
MLSLCRSPTSPAFRDTQSVSILDMGFDYSVWLAPRFIMITLWTPRGRHRSQQSWESHSLGYIESFLDIKVLAMTHVSA